MRLLAVEYRPKTFADLCGQDTVRVLLQAFAFSQEIPPALLFSGPSGTGKTSAARIFAAVLNCPNSHNGDCCGKCESCVAIQDGKSLAVQEVDAATSGGVDDIRSLRDLVQFSTGSDWRVIILDEAHSLTRHAFNALLKTLEEPPSQTVFVLVTTEPNKIIGTVRSRAMPVQFKRITPNDVIGRLTSISKAERLPFDEELFKEIAIQADGGMRDAVMIYDQLLRTGDATLEGFRYTFGGFNYAAEIVTHLSTQDLPTAKSELQHFFEHDANIKALVSDLIREFQLRYESNLIGRNQFIAAIKLLWDARSLGEVLNRDTRHRIEALVVLLYSLFPPDKPQQPKSILKEEKSVELSTSTVGLDEALALMEG